MKNKIAVKYPNLAEQNFERNMNYQELQNAKDWKITLAQNGILQMHKNAS